ncbi:hypothetical protein SAMN05216312_102215 [Cohnella sp. OV330]|uniref:phage major tail tube protein n=1 Tax=Cohnella sp. OV330 TaxID=1855288 RepID=UPI0008E89808|nr:phage major tail tube protein [Cohnella sp. OV330]SFA91551.1 hypothetical protein SAMN05216312_102215 [Cohnella sp. OV330]
MNKQVPEKLTGFSAYRDGTDYLGVVDVTLPSFEALTDTVRGAGIAGEIDSPAVGLFGSMTVTLNWRTVVAEGARLLAPKAHALDFRGNMQTYDIVTGQYNNVGVKVTLRAVPKKFDLGKFDANSTTDTSNDLEVIYIKVVVDTKSIVELDKYNYVYVVDGVDYMADIRKNLGI